MEERRLRPPEREAWLELMQAAFGERELFDRYLAHDPGLDYDDTLVIFDGPRLAAGLQIFTRTVHLRGEEVVIGGLGSVATHPDYERRGLGTRNLRRVIAELERRRVFASLLYSTREGFYGRLGWAVVPSPYWVWHPPEDPSSAGAELRPVRAQDLPAVRTIYEGRVLDLHTVRDDAYWAGQLRCAGEPDEDFRVAVRDGEVVAYARGLERQGVVQVMELGERDRDDALPALLGALARGLPSGRPLFVPDDGTGALEARLRASARRLDRVHFPDAMWRLFDVATAQRLAGGEDDPDALVQELFGAPGALFWLSDRF